jgi:hypothetical protein
MEVYWSDSHVGPAIRSFLENWEEILQRLRAKTASIHGQGKADEFYQRHSSILEHLAVVSHLTRKVDMLSAQELDELEAAWVQLFAPHTLIMPYLPQRAILLKKTSYSSPGYTEPVAFSVKTASKHCTPWRQWRGSSCGQLKIQLSATRQCLTTSRRRSSFAETRLFLSMGLARYKSSSSTPQRPLALFMLHMHYRLSKWQCARQWQ